MGELLDDLVGFHVVRAIVFVQLRSSRNAACSVSKLLEGTQANLEEWSEIEEQVADALVLRVHALLQIVR